MRLRILTLLMLTLFTVSCAGSAKPALEIQEPWVTEAKISAISAADVNKSCLCDVKTAATTTTAYMTIQNNTRVADHLLKVESDAASRPHGFVDLGGAGTGVQCQVDDEFRGSGLALMRVHWLGVVHLDAAEDADTRPLVHDRAHLVSFPL